MMNEDSLLHKPTLRPATPLPKPVENGDGNGGGDNMAVPNEAEMVLLTSYLDGEVDAATRREIETRLATEPEFHRQMIALEESWLSLELLETLPTDKKLLETTMDLLTVAVQEELKNTSDNHVGNRYLRGAAIASVLFLLASTVYWMVFLWLPNPNRQLLEDMPVIENLEFYQPAGTFEFLRKLHDSELFQTGE